MDLIREFIYNCLNYFGIDTGNKSVLSFIIPLTLLLLLGIVYIVIKRKNIFPKYWRKEKINEILMPDYGEQLQEQEFFVSSKFITTLPDNLDDPTEVERVESAKKLIDHLLDKVLVESNSTNRHFCILAGAGMGKTTMAVNLVTSYIKKYRKSTIPFNIKLIGLARNDFSSLIKDINEPSKTILVLDALDENVDASVDLTDFMSKLDDLITPFRFVILTSRTQFFSSEDEEPSRTNILNMGRDKGCYTYYKFYISPFSQEDVQEFLHNKYNNRKQRKKAKKIVEQCSSLATRPLLLSHLDDLLNSNRSYNTLSSIYKTLIDVWIQREVRFNQGGDDPKLQQRLYDFSLDFAVELFNNRDQSTNMRMSRDKYLEFINRMEYNDYNFSGRSLINRDASGTMKFSHKTFYEYFLAKAKFQNPYLEIPTKGYELAWDFYREMVHEKVSQQSIFTFYENNTAMFINSKSIEDFNFNLLDGVYNIQKVSFFADLLANTSNFTKWLSASKVMHVDLCDYFNEPLKLLLSMNDLKSVHIIKKHAYNSIKVNNVIQKLNMKDVEVDIANMNLPRGAKIYLDKIGIDMYEILESHSPYKYAMIQAYLNKSKTNN